jgi:hypothetical protein
MSTKIKFWFEKIPGPVLEEKGKRKGDRQEKYFLPGY